MAETVLAVDNLSKEYRTSFRRKRVLAVDKASFAVERGEIFGFVGPNGAGKTTTIRMLMGLIRPTAGRCVVFGEEVPARAARARLGFLPEAPYFYDYLTPRELLDLAGRLCGVERAERRRRADELLARVGLAGAADRQLRKFSKGMLQRAGLAQALVHDPELVVLDEPMSGLDPIGRKEVRDLILWLRDAGKTVFFSTHILPDVEAVCDRVAIIAGGAIQEVGPVAKLLDASLLGTEIVVRLHPEQSLEGRLPAGVTMRAADVGDDRTLVADAQVDVTALLVALAPACRVVSVTPRRDTLEELFLRRTKEAAS
jgi:ABC-2 type transport system ATP-binding protein